MADDNKTVTVEKLVRVYLKLNAHLTEIRHNYEAEEKVLKEKMALVKSELLAHCKEHNVDSVRTSEGLFYRSVKMNYWTSDWESMRKFIVENNALELLHERIHQTNMKQFLEDNPDKLPPGLNVDSEYVITVRRK